MSYEDIQTDEDTGLRAILWPDMDGQMSDPRHNDNAAVWVAMPNRFDCPHCTNVPCSSVGCIIGVGKDLQFYDIECGRCQGFGELSADQLGRAEIIAAWPDAPVLAAEGFTVSRNGWQRVELQDATHALIVTPESAAVTGLPPDTIDRLGRDATGAEVAANQDARELQSWFDGEVYGWTVETPDGDVLESCWGYVGDPSYCKGEAICALRDEVARIHKDEVERLHKERKAVAYWNGRDVQTVEGSI